MTVAHPSVLFPFLAEIDAAPKKGLSQNFLIDANIVRKIAAEIKPGDRVLEVGPGPGALTQELLRRGAQVIAIEKDRRFAEHLSRLGPVEVFEADFLTFDLSQLQGPLKVAANLPYHIATPILEKLCEARLFSSALVMVQKEMADRMVAQPGSKTISSFTHFLRTYATVSLAVPVSRHCFYPAPKVDSCVVKLVFHAPPLPDPRPFHAWMRQAFQQRRKMLRSTLGIDGPHATRRPEQLSFDEWLQLYLTAEKK